MTTVIVDPSIFATAVMRMTLDWKRMGAFSGILGGILFVVITLVNMTVYPGGYSFLENYFSQLGMTEVGGQDNLLGYVLFSAACTSAAVFSIPFWITIRTAFTSNGFLKTLSWLGTILGLVAAPCLSALALFAADLYLFQHGWATLLFFILYSAAIIAYSTAMVANREYNRLYSLIGFAVAAICLIHIFMIQTALMQKLAVYSLVLWSAFQGYRLLQLLKAK